MQDIDVVIVGIARDNGNDLKKVITHIETTGSLFRDYKVIIYENDSTDNTKEILQSWENRNDRVTIVQETKGWGAAISAGGKNRYLVLAYCRNQYLKMWMTFPIFQKYQYMIVVDMDLKHGWDQDGVAHSFGYTDWDMICSNGILRGEFYDTLALRDKRFSIFVDDLKQDLRDELDVIAYPTVGPLIAVDSCFGGLAIYNRSAIGDCLYQGYDCEHVTLHNCMVANNHSRIYLNPLQVVYYSK